MDFIEQGRPSSGIPFEWLGEERSHSGEYARGDKSAFLDGLNVYGPGRRICGFQHLLNNDAFSLQKVDTLGL